MRYQFKFDQILHIKEREKDDALSFFNEAVRNFEEVAEKLYDLLKKKEDLEFIQSEQLINGLSVQEIRHHQQFILNLVKSIEHYQKMVMNARNRMNFLQDKLLEKNIEVKKFVKMKEKDFDKFLNEVKYLDAKQMDDISIQQFMFRGN